MFAMLWNCWFTAANHGKTQRIYSEKRNPKRDLLRLFAVSLFAMQMTSITVVVILWSTIELTVLNVLFNYETNQMHNGNEIRIALSLRARIETLTTAHLSHSHACLANDAYFGDACSELPGTGWKCLWSVLVSHSSWRIRQDDNAPKGRKCISHTHQHLFGMNLEHQEA